MVKETNATGQATTYGYDDAGRRTSLLRPTGVKITYEYDPGGRLLLRQSYRSDNSVELADRFVWDDGNRLAGWTTNNASSTSSYDDAGRLLSETVTIDGVNLARTYTYHANGQVKTYVGPDGVVVSYSYNGNGQLARVDLPGEGSISITERRWNGATKIVLPGGTVQGIERNGMLSPTRLRVKSPAQSVVFDQQSAYGKREELLNRTTQGQRIDYNHDDALRLLSADPSGWGGTTETFVVDAADNRLSDNKVASTWQYDDANRLIQRGAVSYQYDLAGNRPARDTLAANRPSRRRGVVSEPQ